MDSEQSGYMTADFDYSLPEELIAQHPTEKREASRMMVVDRQSGTITHDQFSRFPTYLREGDRLVLNNTKVIPGRLYTQDGKVEILLIEETRPRHWTCIVRPGKKVKPGVMLDFGPVKAECLKTLETGERVIRFLGDLDLDKWGTMPLPPYIARPVGGNPFREEDRERYQTVFAQESGAVAAPTAGLHFTPEILQRCPHTFVTLHVGIGTFRPVKVEKLEDHDMHAERYFISSQAADEINGAKRVVAIGTTSVRTLESAAQAEGDGWRVRSTRDWKSTRIFIYPPYRFKMTGAMLTNFHLPKSTLLMLVSAFAGRELIQKAYTEAVREKYRFFSYGDCMLII